MKKLFILILILFLTGCAQQTANIGADNIQTIQEKFNAAAEIKTKYQLDRISLKRQIIKNAELDKYKNEPKDEIKITIGENTSNELLGADTQEFIPSIELKRWNEVSFKIKPI